MTVPAVKGNDAVMDPSEIAVFSPPHLASVWSLQEEGWAGQVQMKGKVN